MLHPWAIAIGVAALAGPLVVHLLTRPRPARLPLSTIRFVIELVQQRRARKRLRDALILALRTTAVALLALAVARPLSGGRRPEALDDSPAAAVRVVLLDVSQSMAARHGSVRVFERARAIAARQLADQAGRQVNLILAAAAPQSVFDRVSANAAALRDVLGDARPLPQRLNVQPALNRAAELLSSPAGQAAASRELVIVSDFQRASWAAADFSALPVGTIIQLESVASEDAPSNLAVLRVGPRGRVEQGRAFALEVDVGNYSVSQRKVEVEVTLGTSVYHLAGSCPPGVVTTLAAEATLREPGWQMGEARLLSVDDALSADDRRAVAVEARRPPKYLLLTRQPAGSPRSSRPPSSFFVDRALAPFASRDGQPSETVIRTDPARLEPEALSAADLIVLDHPGKLSAPTLRTLASLAQRGRGILYIAAEPIDAANLSLLAEAAGTGLQMPVEFAPPQAGQARRNRFIADFVRREPPFSIFGDEATAAVASLRFSGGLISRRREGALLDDVRATFDDQSACLVVTAVGAGRLGVLNADLAASNLPVSPTFVPFMGELVAHLLGQDRPSAAVACGEPAASFLPAAAGDADDLRIESPQPTTADASALGELRSEPIGVLWRMPAAGPPGVYRVLDGDHTVFALATAIPADESDLTPLASSLLTGRLAGGRTVQYHAATQSDAEPRDELWTWLALACVGCLIGEVFGLRLFRS
ncbi:MAG TPA: BatA and WFA domain-containing protein [Pirellulales bacterium]|nr:BatA and WFA domain-containing protein [Pirellulales bacterium]